MVKTKKKSKQLHVAVVYSEVNGTHSGRRDGSYACFVDTSANKAAERAVVAANAWTFDKPFGPYEVLVGTLTQRAQGLVRLKKGGK